VLSDGQQHISSRRHCVLCSYAMAFWISQPVLPFISKSLGADAVTFGYLQTAFSAVQMVGGPLVGRLCDSYGPGYGLQLSQSASAASYLLLASAVSLPLLFASRLPTLGMHTVGALLLAMWLQSIETNPRSSCCCVCFRCTLRRCSCR
jgi:MFS family permease